MATNGTNSSYIDFHSHDQVEVDYSTRIFSQGGSTIGGGTLFLTASTCSFSNSIGIGTSNPQYKLQVNSGSINATNYSQHHWNNNSIGIGVFFSTPTYWKIATLGLNTAPSSFGALTVKGTLGGFVNPATPTMHVDLSFSTRGNITVTGSVQSSNIANAQAIMDIGYVTTATGYDVYLYLKTGDYYTFDFVTSGHLGSTENVYLYDPATVVPTTTSPGTITSLTSMCQIYNTSGNIGIGTTAPASLLETCSGNALPIVVTRTGASNNFGAGIQYSLLSEISSFRGTYARTFGGTIGFPASTLQSQANGYFAVDVANAGVFISDANPFSSPLYITNSKSVFNTNLGIGTTNPLGKLHIRSTTTGHPSVLRLQNNVSVYGSSANGSRLEWYTMYNGNASDYFQAAIQGIDDDLNNAGSGAGGLAFLVNKSAVETEAMRIASNGSVGIGTNFPTSKLQINGSGGTGANLRLVSDSPGEEVGIGFYRNTDYTLTNPGDLWVHGVKAYGVGDRNYGFGCNTTTLVLSLMATGNVGIGTTSPKSLLQLMPSGATASPGSNGVLQITCSSTSPNIDGISLRASNDGYNIINFDNTSGIIRGYIAGVNSSSVSYNTSSDRRLKEEIHAIEGALSIVKQLNPVHFKWKNDNEYDFGMIAQEVYKILPFMRPNLSGYIKDCTCTREQIVQGIVCEHCLSMQDEPVDENGIPRYYSLDYGKFTPYLIGAMKEMNQIIETQQSTITSLQNQLSTVLSRLTAAGI